MSRRLLVRVWVSALCGAAKTCLWPSSPRLLSALTYVAVGWSAVPYMPLLTQSVDMHVTVLVSDKGLMIDRAAEWGTFLVIVPDDQDMSCWLPADGLPHTSCVGVLSQEGNFSMC